MENELRDVIGETDYRGVDVIEENVTRRSKTYAALDVWGVAT